MRRRCMDLVRHELGFSKTESRFPGKGTCLDIYSRVVNSREGLEDVLACPLPQAVQWASELKQLFRGYVEAKQRTDVLDYDDLLLYWAEMMADPDMAATCRRRCSTTS
jgi:DNA helicase II / ATP-dependent DNA helicase PcrA